MIKKEDGSVSEKSSQSTLKRRTFSGVTSAISAMAASGAGPAIAQSRPSRPVVISSGNGFVYRNGGSETCVERAYRMMTEGADVLESLVAGVNIVELDPEDTSVGFGGLPDAEGNVIKNLMDRIDHLENHIIGLQDLIAKDNINNKDKTVLISDRDGHSKF